MHFEYKEERERERQDVDNQRGEVKAVFCVKLVRRRARADDRGEHARPAVDVCVVVRFDGGAALPQGDHLYAGAAKRLLLLVLVADLL